jgi:hypothetical protein
MALSKPELALARGRAQDMEARLRAAPEPKFLPRNIIQHLQREGGSAARLIFEHRQLDELLGESALIGERVFKLAELDANLRLEQEIANRQRDIGAAPSEQKARIAADLSECVGRATELRARSAALSARVFPLEQRLQRCRERVAAAVRGGAPLRFIAPPTIDKKLTLAATRERVLQINADIREIEAAPHTSGEVKRLIELWVDEKLSSPAVGHLFDRGREGSGIYLHGAEVANAWQPDMLGLILWLGRDEIVRRLHAEADRLADDAHALDDAQRSKKMERCKIELLEAERIEEALAWQALQDGAAIVLRGDSDVRAILSIA